MRNLLIVTLLLVGCTDLTAPSGALPLPAGQPAAVREKDSAAKPKAEPKPAPAPEAEPSPGCGG